VFAVLPPGVVGQLTGRFPFYVWDETTGEVRWMCSWDTTAEEVDAFAAAVADACAATSAS
jgi:threonine aldolase